MLTSNRRVKKGSGRRPQSAKRRRFMGLIERGWSIRGAAIEVGVSRTSGNNWSRGYKVYRDGQVLWFVSPLDRPAVRAISTRYLSQDERIEIADLHHSGFSGRQIGERIGRAPSTVSRELRRDCVRGRSYQPVKAHRDAVLKRARRHKRRIETNPQLFDAVADLLTRRWSPQQISRYLKASNPATPQMWLCHESLYQAVYQPGTALLREPKVPSPQQSPLRTGRQPPRAAANDAAASAV